MNTGVRRHLSAEEQRTLAAKAQQGDERSFGVLYEHFSDAVTGHAAARLRSAEDAGDVASDTFTTALTLVKEGRYDPTYTFYTFLKVIADSHIAHYLRKTHVTAPSPSDSCATQYLRRLRPLAEVPEIACLPDQELQICAYELLLVVLACGSKPHQALTFCLVGVLDWRPREVIEQLGSQSLFALVRRVYDDFAGHSSHHARGRLLCRDHCPQFWHLLVSPVRDVYPEQEYHGLRTHVGPVGDLPLSAFYGPRPAASLSDWCHKGRVRARKTLEAGMLPVEGGGYRDHGRR